jgi:hypothetical protein
MQKLWQAHQGQDLQMLALSVDRTPGDASAYLQQKGYTFLAAWVTAEVHHAFPKPRGLPVTLVLSREGKVLQIEKGQMFPEDGRPTGQFAESLIYQLLWCVPTHQSSGLPNSQC